MEGKPEVRVYDVDPGCASGGDPEFKSFRGFYPFVTNAVSIADVSAIPGTSDYVLVIERNNYPGLLGDFPEFGEGHKFPSPALPTNKVCLVDLTDLDDDLVMHSKKCILNYHVVSDPWDVDSDGRTRFGLTQVTTEQLAVVDDYCIVAGTGTNYPWANQLGLDLDVLPYLRRGGARLEVDGRLLRGADLQRGHPEALHGRGRVGGGGAGGRRRAGDVGRYFGGEVECGHFDGGLRGRDGGQCGGHRGRTRGRSRRGGESQRGHSVELTFGPVRHHCSVLVGSPIICFCLRFIREDTRRRTSKLDASRSSPPRIYEHKMCTHSGSWLWSRVLNLTLLLPRSLSAKMLLGWVWGFFSY